MIILPRIQLAAELALLQSVVSKYATIPILDTVRFEVLGDHLHLTASSIDVTLTSEIALPGLVNEPESWCVPAKSLGQLVNLLNGDEIELSVADNGRIKVQCQKSKHMLPYLSATDFPDVERADAEMVILKGDLWATALKHVLFAVMQPTGEVRQSDHKFTGLHVTLADGKLVLAATNKLRLAMATLAINGPEFSVILPHQSLPALQKFTGTEIQFGVSGNFAVLKSGARMLTIRLLDDKPFKWAELFPAKYDHMTEIVADELDGALRRALITASERATFVVNGLKWTFGGNELLIESRDGDNGKSDEVIAITCPTLNGDSLSIGVNGQQVVDYLGVIGDRTRCEFTAGANMVRLSPTTPKEFNYEYLVNTVNLKW